MPIIKRWPFCVRYPRAKDHEVTLKYQISLPRSAATLAQLVRQLMPRHDRMLSAAAPAADVPASRVDSGSEMGAASGRQARSEAATIAEQ
jgi:hypothetical protein